MSGVGNLGRFEVKWQSSWVFIDRKYSKALRISNKTRKDAYLRDASQTLTCSDVL